MRANFSMLDCFALINSEAIFDTVEMLLVLHCISSRFPVSYKK